MALVHKGFSTFRLFTAFYASLTEAALSQKFEPGPRQVRQTIVTAGVGYGSVPRQIHPVVRLTRVIRA
jgi:hypothetical protein